MDVGDVLIANSCPLRIIQGKDRRLILTDFAPLLRTIKPNAVEIHTAPVRGKEFKKTIKEIFKVNLQLKQLSVSSGLQGHGINHEKSAEELWLRHKFLRIHNQKPL